MWGWEEGKNAGMKRWRQVGKEGEYRSEERRWCKVLQQHRASEEGGR